MRILKRITVMLCIVLISCQDKEIKPLHNTSDFTTLENDLKNKFGNQAYYTDLTISYHKEKGNKIVISVSENPENLKMEQWAKSEGNWSQISEILLEAPKGTKVIDYMFQLDKSINLTQLGKLVEKSRGQLANQKKLENSVLYMALISFPKNGDVSKAEYQVLLKPESGGTTAMFHYQIDGTLIKIAY